MILPPISPTTPADFTVTASMPNATAIGEMSVTLKNQLRAMGARLFFFSLSGLTLTASGWVAAPMGQL